MPILHDAKLRQRPKAQRRRSNGAAPAEVRDVTLQSCSPYPWAIGC
jgi:hypothetical protein